MTRRNILVTSQVEGRASDRLETNTYSYDSAGILIRHDDDLVGKPVVGPGVLFGANGDSSDESGLNTIQLVPNIELNSDQYLVIEPTAPNHIHIRAGGDKDESNARLFLGGERTHVNVSDNSREVLVNTRVSRVSQSYTNINEDGNAQFIASMPVPNGQEVFVGWKVFDAGTEYTVSAVAINTPSEGLVTITATNLNNFVTNQAYTFYFDETYNNQWTFGSDGYLYGPAMGGLFVTGILNGEGDLWLSSNNSVVLNGNEGGEFLGNQSVAGNQIAKLSDRAYVRVNVPTTSLGQAGDVAHYVADDTSHHYFCTGTYDGTTHIWKRIAWDAGTWGV